MTPLFIVECLFLAVIVAYLCYILTSPKYTPWYTYVTVFLSWWSSFAIVFLLPIDINATLDCQNDPTTCQSQDGEKILWKILYWSSFFITWVIAPFQGTFVEAGEFTSLSKLWHSIKENVKYYLVLGIIGGGFLVYLALSQHFSQDQLIAFCIAAANMWGLLLIVIFLGHGLVELPKYLFHNGNLPVSLKLCEYQVSTHYNNLDEAEIELNELVCVIRKVNEKVAFHDALRPYVNIIMKAIPTDQPFTDSSVNENSEPILKECTYSRLSNLHYRFKRAVHNYNKHKFLYEYFCMKGWRINDILTSKDNLDHIFQTTLRKKPANLLWAKVEWVWKVKLYALAYKIAGIFCALLTIIIIWSQLTIFVKLSPFRNLVNLQMDDFSAQIVGIIPMSYMYACAFYSLLQLNLFDYYEFMRNHQTDGPSLLFGAGYVSRMTVPLCYHFLTFTVVKNTSFESVMGTQDVAFIVGENFFIYFPIIVVVLTVITYFDLYTKLLRLCNVTRFDFGSASQSKDETILETGKKLMKTQREKYELNLTGKLPSGTISPRKQKYDNAHRPEEDPKLRTSFDKKSDSGRPPAATSPRLTPQTTPSKVTNKPQVNVRNTPTISKPEHHYTYTEDDVNISLKELAIQTFKPASGKTVARNKDKTKFEQLEDDNTSPRKGNKK